ncbi:hypothetical protein ACFVFS_23100 [Kitasatospora sp. NPDC057692]|uniref:DUF7507 domain-containing protein n=1 Tax=Kitasatospora sp. NPDC057692 TaxID=3346215 RepID=UPI0036915A5D
MGQITNTAQAMASPPSGSAINSPPSSATVTASQAPSIAVVKSASPTTVSTVGESVAYSFQVTNTGNVDLTNVTVADTVFSGTGTPPVISCPSTMLAVGASLTCTATYTVTQADVDAGRVTNTATATDDEASDRALGTRGTGSVIKAALPPPELWLSLS